MAIINPDVPLAQNAINDVLIYVIIHMITFKNLALAAVIPAINVVFLDHTYHYIAVYISAMSGMTLQMISSYKHTRINKPAIKGDQTVPMEDAIDW
jgi:hypothetical protein